MGMKKEIFNGAKLKVARIYRGKTVDQLAKEVNINKKDTTKEVISFIF